MPMVQEAQAHSFLIFPQTSDFKYSTLADLEAQDCFRNMALQLHIVFQKQ